jgi:predicted hydrocarbon binding protein
MHNVPNSTKRKMTYQVTLDIEEEAILPTIHCPVGTIEDAILAGIVAQIQEQIEKKPVDTNH